METPGSLPTEAPVPAAQHQILCAHQVCPVVTGAEGDEREARPRGWGYFRHGDQESLWGEGFISADLRRREEQWLESTHERLVRTGEQAAKHREVAGGGQEQAAWPRGS